MHELRKLLYYYENKKSNLELELHKYNTELLNIKDELEIQDKIADVSAASSIIPTMLGLLAALLLPTAFQFSVISLIISAVIVGSTAFVTVPKYIKWYKAEMAKKKLTTQITDLEQKIQNCTETIDILDIKRVRVTKVLDCLSTEDNPCQEKNNYNKPTKTISSENIR